MNENDDKECLIENDDQHEIHENSMNSSDNKDSINDRKSNKLVDINDQNELDYEEEEMDVENKNSEIIKNPEIDDKDDEKVVKEGSNDEGEDGEISSESEDGEVRSTKEENSVTNDNAEEKEAGEIEDGEIDDGENAPKPFIPKIPCKYYQRGRCNWGRSCKFLHPGINDTGNYTFLDVEDPTAKFLSNKLMIGPNDENRSGVGGGSAQVSVVYPPTATENAWERGQRYAREMKEKAMRRKQAEKDFNDKKMNLSLKDLEDEKENDERHVNIERPPRNDLDDEEIVFIDRSDHEYRKREKLPVTSTIHAVSHKPPTKTKQKDSNYVQEKPDRSKRRIPQRAAERPAKPDEWYDYWDRGRQPTKKQQQLRRSRSISKGRTRSYSRSSSSSSRTSRSSRSSYTSQSKSSRSSSRSSYSSRSPSRSTVARKKNETSSKPMNVQKGATKDIPLKKSDKTLLSTKISSQASSHQNTNKFLPGRQVSDLALKKAVAESDKLRKKREKSRSSSSSRSSSASSSYSSHSSQSSNSSRSSQSASESSYSSSESEDFDKIKKNIKVSNVKNPKSNHEIQKSKSSLTSKQQSVKEDLKKSLASLKNTALKRQTSDKTSQDSKKQRMSPSYSANQDKKQSHKQQVSKSNEQRSKPKDVQMIKEQLKLVENALSKKKAMAK